jgi:hypothetical protein
MKNPLYRSNSYFLGQNLAKFEGGVREECGGKERDLTGKIVRRAANHHFNCLITFA